MGSRDERCRDCRYQQHTLMELHGWNGTAERYCLEGERPYARSTESAMFVSENMFGCSPAVLRCWASGKDNGRHLEILDIVLETDPPSDRHELFGKLMRIIRLSLSAPNVCTLRSMFATMMCTVVISTLERRRFEIPRLRIEVTSSHVGQIALDRWKLNEAGSSREPAIIMPRECDVDVGQSVVAL